MSANDHLTELYNAYDGDWRRFFNDVSRFWKEQTPEPKIEQPFLLGCPWCGVVPSVRKMPFVLPDTYDVTCRNSRCPRRSISATTPSECAEKWNTRIPV